MTFSIKDLDGSGVKRRDNPDMTTDFQYGSEEVTETPEDGLEFRTQRFNFVNLFRTFVKSISYVIVSGPHLNKVTYFGNPKCEVHMLGGS